MPSLPELGWNEHFARAYQVHDGPGMLPGRVALEHNQFYRVLTQDAELLAEAAGRLKHEAAGRHELPAVGDWVALKYDAGGDQAVIRAVLPRLGKFSRKSAGAWTDEQVVAANIDTVFLVSGLDGDFNPRRIERYLTLARQSQARPVVILNKTDLADDVAEAVALIVGMAPDVPVLAISAVDGQGFESLIPYLGVGMTVALLGSSGVGKSSIVNRLVGARVLPTRSVRESDSRGRHASVHRQMITLPGGGLVIDTPGMRELQLWGVDKGMSTTFEDIDVLGAGCRFRDCRHQKEPGCAVKAAVEDDTLDAARYENYVKLQLESAELQRRLDERALLEQKRQSKVRGKALKALQKDRDR
ncbi:MAG: ribosome small subunit-dependent GTPase A [Acidobacteria bacterium]|nr:ribosome small subunit-dependent GTPase A [Acidobacteriota bacterium]